jgi:hypothetical protein
VDFEHGERGFATSGTLRKLEHITRTRTRTRTRTEPEPEPEPELEP